MIIKRNISKQTISELAQGFFPGRIFVVQTETEAEKRWSIFPHKKVIGIDSETLLVLYQRAIAQSGFAANIVR